MATRFANMDVQEVIDFYLATSIQYQSNLQGKVWLPATSSARALLTEISTELTTRGIPPPVRLQNL